MCVAFLLSFVCSAKFRRLNAQPQLKFAFVQRTLAGAMVLGLAEQLKGKIISEGGPLATEQDLAACLRALAAAIKNDCGLPHWTTWTPEDDWCDSHSTPASTTTNTPRPELMWHEMVVYLTNLSRTSSVLDLRQATCLLAKFAYTYRRRQVYSVDTADATLEGMRAEGLRTMKKWRPWQTHKSVDKMSAQSRFMLGTGGHGVLDFRMVDCPKMNAPQMTKEQWDAIKIEFEERLYSLVSNEVLASALIAALLDVVEHLPVRFPVGPYTSEPLEARLNGFLVYIETTRPCIPFEHHETPDVWAARMIGDPCAYLQWREQRAVAQRSALEVRETKAAGRDSYADLCFLRPAEHLCPRCQRQTFLVAEQVRRVDEACEWYRVCVRCGTRQRT